MLMFNLLDIAYPGRHPRILPPDTVYIVKPAPDNVTNIGGVKDPAATKTLVDSCKECVDSCKDNVIDTLHSAVNWLNGTGMDTPHSSSLVMTTIVVLAALTLCAGFVWMYRRKLAVK